MKKIVICTVVLIFLCLAGCDRTSVLESSTDVQRDELPVTQTNQAPQIQIEQPVSGATYSDSHIVTFRATARDNSDGDVSASIQWHSDVDNTLGNGSNVATRLTVGSHLISATVIDSVAASASASITVIITPSNLDPDSEPPSDSDSDSEPEPEPPSDSEPELPSDPAPELPPDPSSVAPRLDLTLVTRMKDATAFLYTGTNPIQTGINPVDIIARRVSVIRGTVLNRDYSPLGGVVISIKDHPEFGQTLSRVDGVFDMVVNGGGVLTINYQKTGFLPVQRQVKTPWRGYVHPDDVVMITLDPQASTIDLSSSQSIQVAQGSLQTDVDGTRQATVFFPQGTTASMTLPDGSTQPLTTLNVRATEYTVGDNGPEAMPGALPANSGYTYAVEFSVDEAIASGASRVDFNQPLPVYIDNFLDFPTGEVVPVGWYDREKSAWIASKNGRVIEILDIIDNMAALDIDGSGSSADATALLAMGISDAERIQLALTYSIGKTLWRTPITHFTPWDYNWPYGPPDDAEPPPDDEPKPDEEDTTPPDDSDCVVGCIIDAQNQNLGEEVSVVGTPFKLHYKSDRVIGLTSLTIPLSGDRVPFSLKNIDLTIEIVGRKITKRFSADVNQSYEFLWDGLDAYGRVGVGYANAKITVHYNYDIYYYPSFDDFENSFGRLPKDTTVIASRSGTGVKLNRVWHKRLQRPNNLLTNIAGLGNWSLTAHHSYNPEGKILHRGNGNFREANSTTGNIVSTIAGDGLNETTGDGGPAKEASSIGNGQLAMDSDGSLYLSSEHYIRKIDPDGVITRVAGNGSAGYNGYSGDVGPATSTSIRRITSMVAIEGILYFSSSLDNRIRKIDKDGIISTVAGNGEYGVPIDGQLATSSPLANIYGLAIDIDGAMYISSNVYGRIYKVGPDGIISTVVGNGISGFSGDGGLATDASIDGPRQIILSGDGGFYFSDGRNHRIRKVGPSGIITTIAGTGDYNVDPFDNGVLATDKNLRDTGPMAISPVDGSLYIKQLYSILRIDSKGVINTVAGTHGVRDYNGDYGLGINTTIMSGSQYGITFDLQGRLIFSDTNRIRQIGNVFLSAFENGALAIANSNGNQLFIFDAEGRHQQTLDTTTGAILYRFTYTDDGYLSTVVDVDGRVTSIERDSSGIPWAIIAPDGQRTELVVDASGNLSQITNPAGDRHQMQYTDKGLISLYTDPRGNSNEFSYDAFGRLIQDESPDGGGWVLNRTNNDTEDSYTVSMTSGEGRTRLFAVQSLSTGARLQTNTATDGTIKTTLFDTNGTETTTYPDGTELFLRKEPDPRFGIFSPVPSELTIAMPSGLVSTLTTERTSSLSDPNDFLSHTALSEIYTFNGKTSTAYYDEASRTWTNLSPEGRELTRALDQQGRLVTSITSGLAANDYSYNVEGRLETVSQNASGEFRSTQFNYYSSGAQQGFLATIIDAQNRQVSFNYDAAGRVTLQTLPDGREIGYGYDATGNLTRLTTPGKNAHYFNYSNVDLETNYSPPDVGGVADPATRYQYNLDKQLALVTRPDGQTVEFVYHPTTGKQQQLLITRGAYSSAYDASTGLLASITAPDNSAINYTYDGSLLLGSTWSGEIAGQVNQNYSNDFTVINRCINGTDCVNFSYDDDLLLTQVGDLSIGRNLQMGGLITDTALSGITTARTYSAFAELDAVMAEYGSTALYSSGYTRDLLGRITEQVQTVQGTTTTTQYRYDLAGRLEAVLINGLTSETYGYDSNSNRTHLNGVQTAVYDDQDRLILYGDNSYAYTDNGELLSKTNTTAAETTLYSYDVLGNLMQVALPNGATLDYVIDGQNRRIGKLVNGVLERGFLYKDQLNPVAELDANNNIVSRFVYGDKAHVPAYMIKDGVTYRIISDHLGSPRLVVNVNDGTVVQRLDYDVWGQVITDTNPGFQPFGFAGGIYDSHTKLTRFGARDYDAQVGHWTSKDPIRFEGGDANLFGYVAGDPVNGIDPWGLAGTAVGTPASPVIYFNLQPVPRNRRNLNRALQNLDTPEKVCFLGQCFPKPYVHNPIPNCYKVCDKDNSSQQCPASPPNSGVIDLGNGCRLVCDNRPQLNN